MAKKTRGPRSEAVPSATRPFFLAPRTKIVATLGPKSDTSEAIEQLIEAGARVFRLNFSHGTHAEHLERIAKIHRAERKLNIPIGILADICGPKIRIGEVAAGAVDLHPGNLVTLTPGAANGSGKRFHISYRGLADAAEIGQPILLDDGQLELRVVGFNGRDVMCETITGGILKPRKGVNLPRTKLPISAVTAKDKKDMSFALSQGVDAFALSFVRSAADLDAARRHMKRCGRTVPLYAKIEKAEAVENLEEIILLSDGAMVARGDLGVEVPVERVAGIQKQIIKLCNRHARTVITATQMLDSMIRNPQPTRAEVTDVYNAVCDGTDALMLSGETAAGAYPIESVQMMAKVAHQAEASLDYYLRSDRFGGLPGDVPTTDEVMARVAILIARELKLDAILVPTTTGSTARRVSRYRPNCPILACSLSASTVHALTIAWGVIPREMEPISDEENSRLGDAEAIVRAALYTYKRDGFLHSGQRVAVLAGIPLYVPGSTNFVHVVTVE